MGQSREGFTIPLLAPFGICREPSTLRKVGELSGGERQRVMIARALVQETGVVLLDEPTSNLDVCHQMGVMEVLRSLAEEEGLAVVIALHDLNLAATYCRRLMVLPAPYMVPVRPGHLRGGA